MGRGNGLPRTLESVASQLNTHFPTVAYIIPTTEDFGGSPLQQRDGYCIESCLGHSAKHEGYSTYALAQSVCAAYPTLVITFVVDLRDPDREPAHGPARITAAIDHNLSAFFLPAIFTAFNDLDPTGRRRGVVVQSYNAQMALGDLLPGSLYTVQLVRSFKRDGQLALIAVDFSDPLLLAMAGLLGRLTSILGGDIHLFRRTEVTSSTQMPIQREGGGYYFIGDNSVALDQGIAIAREYLAK